ncbi:MAG: ATP-binding protein, partial [Pseudonocardia sp.]
SGLTVHLRTGDLRTAAVPQAVQLTAYRILQESLTNAAKHAPGSVVRVTLTHHGGELRLGVVDDGAAVPPADGPPTEAGYGILGMGERARAVAGSCTAGRTEDGGFEVVAVLPTGRSDPTS